MTVPVLILSGPVGVGKTTVADEVSTLLEDRVPHTFLDLDALCQTYPRPPGDRFGAILGLQNLRSVWANAHASGSLNLILPRVIETSRDLQAIADCIPGSAPVICQLEATPKTLESRLRVREIGSRFDRALARSLQLRDILHNAPADHRIATDDRTVSDIAHEVVTKVDWRQGT